MMEKTKFEQEQEKLTPSTHFWFLSLHMCFISTSGRSTKLIHGGIRYLETAFKKLDYGSYALVKVSCCQ